MQRQMFNSQGAEFSPCRTWRYKLWRVWQPEKLPLVVIGLNPSTADENVNDPTIRRCISFARTWGHGGLVMMNLFAFRATNPIVMRAEPAERAIGPGNDEALRKASEEPGTILAAWGSLPLSDASRAAAVMRIFHQRPIYCLGQTKHGGWPRHPLYVPGSQRPEMYRKINQQG